MLSEVTDEPRIRGTHASDNHPRQLVRAVVAVMGLVAAVITKSEQGSLWAERLIKRLAHDIQIDQCNRVCASGVSNGS